MVLWWLIAYALLSASVLVLERLGFNTLLPEIKMKGDIKRESRFLGQYGQSVCTPVVVLLMWLMDRQRPQMAIAAGIAVAFASLFAMISKRLLGRVRPNREGAGTFLGPTWKHANYRESFPSSHSACAIALSAILAWAYPPGEWVFWSLAFVCAVLRYIMDAHYPSDVLAGLFLGLAVAAVVWVLVVERNLLSPLLSALGVA